MRELLTGNGFAIGMNENHRIVYCRGIHYDAESAVDSGGVDVRAQ